jgi:hypothetical protein
MTITATGISSPQVSAPPPPPPPPLSPVQQGDIASGRAAVVDGQVFAIGDRSAPATATWGDQPAGTPYRQTFDAVAARLGTSDRAAVTAEIDQQLYGQSSAASPFAGVSASGTVSTGNTYVATSATATASTEDGEGVGSFFEGAIKGDLGDNGSWSALGGQTVVGFIPIVGQIADARDTIAAAGKVIGGEEGGWTALGAAAIGWVPGLGDAAKGGIRAATNVADAGADVARRSADDVAGAAADTARITRSVDPATGRVQISGEGGTTGAWPRELNARTLEPNADYRVNGYDYATDASGRVTTVEGRLNLETAPRNGYQQQVSGRTDRLPDDQGGHLIASIFNGPGDRLNLVPMNGNFNMGAWRSMEGRFADNLAAGRTVDVRIEAVYPADSTRPTGFVVTSITDGGRPVRDVFQNAPGGQ